MPAPLPRLLAPTLRDALARFPVVVVTGARQTGKSTLCRDLLAEDRETVTFDDVREIEIARREPKALLARAERLTLDEVQRVPEILLAVKADVDRRRRPGRFLLTGSANLLLLRRVTESLAGRAVFFQLGGLTTSEERGAPSPGPWSEMMAAKSAAGVLEALPGRRFPRVDWASAAIRGGLPPATLARDSADRSTWLAGYVASYLERDLRDVSAVTNLPDLRRVMVACAERVGERTNQAEIALASGVSHPTAHRYLNLLEVTFQLRRLPPYTASRSERLVKSPRLFFGDTGIAAHLLGVEDASEIRDSSAALGLLENVLLRHLAAWREATSPTTQILFWRTALARRSVSFVLEAGRKLLPIDVSRLADPGPDAVASLTAFLDDQGERAKVGLLLHDGEEAYPLTSRLAAVPLGAVL